MTVARSHNPDDEFPPPAPAKQAYQLAALGALLCGAAAAMALIGSEPGWITHAQLLMSGFGLLIAGSAISLNPRLPLVWWIAAAACLAATRGLPPHWDSARLLAAVGTAVALAGGLLVALPTMLRLSIISAMAIWHFGGIFMATTWPDPTPWTTHQIGTRMYLPYLMFMYLRNAYHFYSPDPGPASLFFALVKYEELDTKGKPIAKWFVIPTRHEHMRDPLGLTYYRRLSLTEQAAQTIPPVGFSFEQSEIQRRRLRAAGRLHIGMPDYPKIPIAPNEFELEAHQYRPPRPDITRYLLPSYADHLLRTTGGQSGEQKLTPRSVKLYRLEHRVLPAAQFQRVLNGKPVTPPYHPTTYRPYYLGEFARNPETGRVEHIDPQDPLLYWLVPILPWIPSPNDPQKRDWIDYMKDHSGYEYDWSSHLP